MTANKGIVYITSPRAHSAQRSYINQMFRSRISGQSRSGCLQLSTARNVSLESDANVPCNLCTARCNTPPTIVAERSWNLAENTAIGARVNQFRGLDTDNDALNFFIGAPTLLPGLRFLDGTRFFRVDSTSGAVYLQESLDGMRGQRLMIGAGVNDGVYNAKMDIVIQVTPSDGSQLPPSNNRFNSVPLPASVNPPPILSSGSPALPPRPQLPPGFTGSKEVDFGKWRKKYAHLRCRSDYVISAVLLII